MSNRVYIYGGKNFIWKASIYAHMIDKPDICERCNGSGHLSTLFCMDDPNDENGKCPSCHGRKTKFWLDPLPDTEAVEFLQKQLDIYREKD